MEIECEEKGTEDKEPSQADLMLYLANEYAIFFHTPNGEAYAKFKNNGVEKNMRLQSKEFEL